MDFDLTEKQEYWRNRVREHIENHVRPRIADFQEEESTGERWKVLQVIEEEKKKAKEAGIWNLFMPPANPNLTHIDDVFEFEGPGLTNLEYALCAEEMGRVGFSSEVFNCSAPDTGNMEVFHRYGTLEQKEQYLRPLMNGELRSAFLMTEPAVASSDATNIETAIVRDGDEYVINGRKWWSSGVGDPRCVVAIVMGKTDPEADLYRQQSQIIVPMDAPGVEVVRMLPVFGYDDAPHGHAEVILKDVRVPAENIVLGEGRGFEISQGRLGPGRIHHCMRAIGAAEKALQLMCERATTRVAFGKPLARLGGNVDIIAQARMDIEQARLLTLRTAWMMDNVDPKEARIWISMIKTVVPNMSIRVVDQAIQMFGALGVSQDTPLPMMYMHQRTLRLADGPDEVHRMVVGRNELRKYADQGDVNATFRDG